MKLMFYMHKHIVWWKYAISKLPCMFCKDWMKNVVLDFDSVDNYIVQLTWSLNLEFVIVWIVKMHTWSVKLRLGMLVFYCLHWYRQFFHESYLCMFKILICGGSLYILFILGLFIDHNITYLNIAKKIPRCK